jgi:hypothetical protein
MATRRVNADAYRAKLTSLVCDLRPDWDGPGVRKPLDDAFAAGHGLGVITLAAVHAATTPTTATPAGITARLRDGWGDASHGWTSQQIEATKTPLPRGQYPRCSCCHQELLPHAGETRESHECPRFIGGVEHLCKRRPTRSDPKVSQLRQQARAKIAAARADIEAVEKAARAAELAGHE